jgi:transformation/transcription domain-associated protein
MHEGVSEYRNDILKYIWGILKADDSNTKYIGYLAVSKFVRVFETPPKVILQVYRSLLRSHSSVERRNVREAISLLLPDLSVRLEDPDLEIALKYTVKLMHEVEDSLPQIVHLWDVITLHTQLFERFKVTIIPYMKHAVFLLGSHLHSYPQYRELSLCLVQLMIEWTDGGDVKSLDQNIADALVNILVRIALLNAESKPNHVHHRVRVRAVTLLQSIISCRKTCNIDPTHFHETTLGLLSSHPNEKSDLHNNNDASPDGDAEDAKRKRSILSVCVHIFSMLQSHDPLNEFLETNFSEILSRCFSLVSSTNDLQLSTMIQNLVACILTDGTASSELISNVTVAVDNAIIESSNQLEETNEGFLAVSIVEKVANICENFAKPFMGSLHMFVEKRAKEHLKEIEESTNTASLVKQGKCHLLSSTPTSGIFGAACGLHFKEVGSSKDTQMNDGDPRNQIAIDGENLTADMRALVTCIILIGHCDVAADKNNSGKGLVEILLALLNASNSLHVLVAVVSIMGRWLLADGQHALLKKSERRAMLLGMARFDFERLSEVEARYLSDQICCFVLTAYGYDRSVIESYPFGVDQNQSASIRVSPNCSLILEETFQKLFIACLLSANQYIRTLCTATFGMRSSNCILVYEELSKLAIEKGCRKNDNIDVAGIPCREPVHILRQLLCADFECLGGRLWTTVVLDFLLATSTHQGGVRARALGSVEDGKEEGFASFMPLKRGGNCAQENEMCCDDFDDGIYASFVESISVERNEQLCGKGRCIAAVRQLIHGDSRTFQSLFEHCFQAAWQNLLCNDTRTSLIHPLEELLAKPYHSQFTNSYNLPKVNAIQSMLRLLVKLRPIPVLDTFLLQSLSSDYNTIHEVLTYFECEYDALRKNEIDFGSPPYDLIKAIQRCYDTLGERDVCTSISSAISSAQTKFALSLDTYGFVTESVDAFGALIDKAGNCESLLPSEDELRIWEQRWVGSHKEMSQWSLIDEFASSHGEARLSLEAAWKTKNWEKLKSLFATPSVAALLEEGDPCAKMTEMYLAIQQGNLDAVDSIHAQIAQLCLYRWQLLPSISTGSQAHQSLLQHFTRLVELRESSQLLVETNAHVPRQTVPDLKTLLTAWKHRSPNLFEPVSEWEDLFLWRTNIFDVITSNFGWVEAPTLATLHDRPHCSILLSRAARKQDLKEVSTFTLSNLGDSIMDVDTAFLKLREEVTTCQYSSENMLKGGLNLVNSANVSYFSDRQKAEVFRLKAYFLNELRDKSKANQAYCQAVQLCPNHARAWQDWGDLCVSLSDATRKKLADDTADKKDLARKASQYLSQAAGCYLEALRVDTSEQSRDRIPHCLSILAADGREFGSVCKTLQARGASTPAWCWLPWIPQLLSSLCRIEALAVKPILVGILKDHPQALYYSLRSFFLERRDVEKSMPDQKSDGATKDEGESQSSLKLAEIIMSSLRKTHPVLWNRLELILDNLIVRFRPSYEAELLQTIIALLSRTAKVEEKMNDKSDGDINEEKQTEYYEKTLSRIGDKFFSKSTSLSKKALHFQSRYGSLFNSDFGQSNLVSFEDFVEKLQKWKSLLERQVSRVPTKCKLSETSPALSWFSSQAPDMWAGACNSKSLSASNHLQDSLSLPQFYDATRSSALKAARASSYSVLLAAQSEGIDGYSGGGAAAVEIPGQYSPTSAGVFDSRPIPELHAKLARFKQILEVTTTGATKQHVHRITMVGSDGKEYKFLLQLAAPYSTRSDERSAQMQFIMCKTLRGDIRACRRGLVVRPNVVIPLAQRMRMSATEDSYQSLEAIFNSVQRSTIDLPAQFHEMVDERLSILGDVDNDERLSAEKNAKLEVYTEICQQFPSNILTKYMMQILPSTEALCQYRKEFSSQLAANSVLQYTLAAVERTPTRFVICNKTGRVLAHDFRSSYNHGLLEKQAVPFRLTRNITEFIGPFLLDGVFVPSFASICGAMSSRQNILEPMLHLLLRDDVISWYTSKTSAANDKKLQDIELQLSDRVWKNVRFVQQRLDSCAPKRVENVVEAIKDNSAPIDMKVRKLVDAACSVERLSSMPTSYQAWL